MSNTFDNFKQSFLDSLYDVMLDPQATDRERKIATFAKNDLENGKYFPAIAKHVESSLEQESLKGHSLTSNTLNFYNGIGSMLDKTTPIGTGRGSLFLNASYLND